MRVLPSVEAQRKTTFALYSRCAFVFVSMTCTLETRCVLGSYSSDCTIESGSTVSRPVAIAAGSVDACVEK